MFSTRRLRVVGALAVTALVAVVAASPGSTATSQTAQIRIWVDNVQKPAIEQIAQSWAASKGASAEVVIKDFGKIRDDLKTVQVATAPDVIVGPHDWIGDLAANGLVIPLNPRKALRTQFPAYALDAFSYGNAVKRLYGAPFALENAALVVNTQLAKVPTSFADFEKQALAFKKKAKGNIALAVPQGAGGDAYHMYPFFSGLGGYVFGKNRAGNFDVSDIGLANPTFLKNAPLIDGWNKSGLLNSKIDYGTGKDAFLKRKAAFWLTGPWETNTLKESGLKFKIVQLPAIKFKSVPFLGVQGYMVTKYSTDHGVESLAKDLVGSFIMGASAQTALAGANGRFPANTQAGKQVKDSVLLQFGNAGAGGVPMPNIPQMGSVWSELGGAWVKATKGAGAVKARSAFRTAAKNIALKIG